MDIKKIEPIGVDHLIRNQVELSMRTPPDVTQNNSKHDRQFKRKLERRAASANTALAVRSAGVRRSAGPIMGSVNIDAQIGPVILTTLVVYLVTSALSYTNAIKNGDSNPVSRGIFKWVDILLAFFVILVISRRLLDLTKI